MGVGRLNAGEKAEVLRDFFIKWYAEHGRSFPWRDEGVSPFGMLVAEMLLRQTTAVKVVPVWLKFLDEFPVPAGCATASEERLRDIVGILGLGYQRARALKDVSQTLVERHAGNVPTSVAELEALPSIGLYASHAVACFALQQRLPVVDINVLRVLSRFTGKPMVRDNRRAPSFWLMAWEILPEQQVQEHNYGLLDFAAQVCKPRRPDCGVCPLNTVCAKGIEEIHKSKASST